MKNKWLILLIVSVFTAQSSWAVKHYITLNAQLGEQSWLTKTEAVKANSSFGIGGGVGINYELQEKALLFSVGVGASPSYSVFTMLPYRTSFEGVDSQGDAMLYTYSFKDRTDDYFNLSVQVPLMIGAQFGKFYFLVGAKFDMSLLARGYVNHTLVSSEGDYLPYIGHFHDMVEHAYFSNVKIETKNSFVFNMNALASAEIGMRLGNNNYKYTGFGTEQKSKIQYRIALYADYGILNALSTTPAPLYSTPVVFNEEDMLSPVGMTDLLHSNQREERVVPLQVGVKFTVLFRVGDPKKCVICEDD